MFEARNFEQLLSAGIPYAAKSSVWPRRGGRTGLRAESSPVHPPQRDQVCIRSPELMQQLGVTGTVRGTSADA